MPVGLRSSSITGDGVLKSSQLSFDREERRSDHPDIPQLCLCIIDIPLSWFIRGNSRNDARIRVP